MKTDQKPRRIQFFFKPAFVSLLIAAIAPLMTGWCLSGGFSPISGHVDYCNWDNNTDEGDTFCAETTYYFGDLQTLFDYACGIEDDEKLVCGSDNYTWTGYKQTELYFCPLWGGGACPKEIVVGDYQDEYSGYLTGPVCR